MATYGLGLPRRTKIERRIEDRTDSEDELFFTIAETKPRSKSLDVRHFKGSAFSRFTTDDCTGSFAQHNTLSSTCLTGGDTPPSKIETLTLGSCTSLVDGLLFDIYDRWHYPQRDSIDSDTFTECSGTSDAFFGRSDSLQLTEFEQRHASWYTRTSLDVKDVSELRAIYSELRHRTGQASAILIRQLKRRDRRKAKSHRNYDLVTAILHAASLKRSIDARIRFSVEPLPGDDAFQQWRDAMKAVARLPLGIPPEFRKKVWLALADQHITNIKLDWEKTKKFAFNEKSNPDDNKLGMQIVKDLHRTGCSGFNGRDNEEDRAVLKRVLLAYARWNKTVGYCQGFNVIAALILEVMERKEDDALKVMILLIDHVLPESYFANNLRALSVDMAVFRDLLGFHLPQLSKHLDHLQTAAADDATGANYEPPLTNVFTMQWFLTIFATCLPNSTALRVWDSILLEGSELLFRTALAIWEKLQDRILAVPSADEFYMTMGTLTQEMLDESTSVMEADSIIKMVYGYGPFPLPNLAELREKYTYNITPFTAAMSAGRRPIGRGRPPMNLFSDEDEWDEDDIADQINCFTGIFPMQSSPNRNKPGELDRSQSGSSYDISKVGPGAFGTTPMDESNTSGSVYQERMTMDLHLLNNQYKRLRHRQKQAHVILTAASAARKKAPSASWMPSAKSLVPTIAPPIESPVAVNHLFIGKNSHQKSSKNKHIADAPNIAPLFPQMSKNRGQVQRSRSGSVRSESGGKQVQESSDKSDLQANQKRSESKENCDSGLTGKNESQSGIQEESPSGAIQDNLQDGITNGESFKNGENLNPNIKKETNDEDSKTQSSIDFKPEHSDVQTKDLENTSQYLAQMMYNRQKKTLLQAANQEKNNNVKDIELSGNKLNETGKQGGSPPSQASHKTHNPFTIRMNPSRAQNGVKLGLYSADHLPVVELGSKRTSRNGVKEIGRAQLNACLHRQYMAEVKQQGRAGKHQ